jgi:hypothetical protein
MQLPKGSTYAIASVYATALAVSAASNASECVLTTAANTYAVGDIIEYSCAGWPRANLRVFRVKAATGTTVTLEGFDTTSTKIFPVGGGAGSVRKISTWTPIPFMKSFEVSGGDPKYQTEEFLDYPDEIQLPNGFSATAVTMTIADDPSAPHVPVMQAATDSQAVTAVRAVLPNGAPLYYNGFVGYNPNPAMGSGAMTVKCGLALQGRVVRYAS